MNGSDDPLANTSPFLLPERGYYSPPYTAEQGYASLSMTAALPPWSDGCYLLGDPEDPFITSPTFTTAFDGHGAFSNPFGGLTVPTAFQMIASTTTGSTEAQHWTTSNTLSPSTIHSQHDILSPQADAASFPATFSQQSTIQTGPDCDPDPSPPLPPPPPTGREHASPPQTKPRKGKRKKHLKPTRLPLDLTLPPPSLTPPPRTKKPKPAAHSLPTSPPSSDPDSKPDATPPDVRERNRRAANKCRTKTKASTVSLEAAAAHAGTQYAALRAEQAALTRQVHLLREMLLGTLCTGCGCDAGAATAAYVRNAAVVIGESGGRCLVWGAEGRGGLWPVKGVGKRERGEEYGKRGGTEADGEEYKRERRGGAKGE